MRDDKATDVYFRETRVLPAYYPPPRTPQLVADARKCDDSQDSGV